MDEIELLENLRESYSNLTYESRAEREKLSLRFKALVRRLLDDKSEYIEAFNKVSFSPISFSIDGSSNEARFRQSWESGHKKALNIIDAVIEDAKLFAPSKKSRNVETLTKKDNTKIFIVHGHDNEAKTEVARFIERLGLEAIILHEQTNSGATIIEKLEKYTDVGFAIVLYTPDDLGAVKTEPDNLNLRARQNVIFEHGLLIGKIGRNNVVALVKETVEIPNDISGVVYETMDSKGAWKYQVAKEMKASDYTIDMNAI